MELRCPSCGNKHLTEDYPEAFEIQCSCGYSLLVPEMASEIVSPGLDSIGFASLPGAIEAQDEANKIAIEKSDLEDPLVNVPKLAESMTPPEELPSDMPYDPFELQQTLAPKEEIPEQIIEKDAITRAIEIAANQTPSDSQEEALGTEESAFTDMVFSQSTQSIQQTAPEMNEEEVPAAQFNPEAEEIQSPETLPSSIKETYLEEAPTLAPAQQIIQRAQLASLGQLIGTSYKLRWADLAHEKAVELQKRCEQVVVPRPWLAAELKRRGIEIQKISQSDELDNVPELLALEIFMAAYELGGTCEFSQI